MAFENDGASRLAERKNVEARELAAKGKLRDALSSLNEAIYASPSYPHSYAARAEVFERLGMFPQAEADRRRAVDLADAQGLRRDDVFAPPREVPHRRVARWSPSKVQTPRVRAPSIARPPDPRPRMRRALSGASETTLVLGAVAVLAGILLVLYLSANALSDSNANFGSIFEFESFQEIEVTPAPSAQPEPEVSATPPPETPPPEVLAGNPFSFSNLQGAWESKGIAVNIGTISNGFNGFGRNPFDVVLSRGEGTASLSVFVYPDRESPKGEWDLPAGSRPSPKDGRTLPEHETIWWNTNLIVVVRSEAGDIGKDALDAMLNLR